MDVYEHEQPLNTRKGMILSWKSKSKGKGISETERKGREKIKKN